jgi:primase-polymerase (primpol)-like protein
MQQITLPYSKKSVEFLEYMPHGVHVKYQQAMFDGVSANMGDFKPTIEDLVEEYGEEKVKALDAIEDDKEREIEMDKLASDYAMRNLEMENVGIANMNKAQMVKILGMVTKLDGKEPTEKDIDMLHQKDYEAVMDKIDEIENVPLEQPSSSESGESLPDSPPMMEQS